MFRYVVFSAFIAFQFMTVICPAKFCRNQSDLYRYKRQSWCRTDEWHCRDGSCIPFDGKCDGAVDCPDASDETHALCRNIRCQINLFRCAYGACVDGTAPCSGSEECADGSDELLPRCRNEIQVIKGKFTCKNGKKISSRNLCDGVKNCGDGSDETLESCAGRRCAPNRFQCEYGACVDAGAACDKDGSQQCADGSDESEELCSTISTTEVQTAHMEVHMEVTEHSLPKPAILQTEVHTEVHTEVTEHSLPKPAILQTPTDTSPKPKCILPEYPKHGSYFTVSADARPGQVFDSVALNLTCEGSYRLDGDNVLFCADGYWSADMPECKRFCKLTQHPSVTYTCKTTGPTILSGERKCKEYEPSGTLVIPRCNDHYYYSGVLMHMNCIDGSWDYVATCQPECGTVTPNGDPLVINGASAKRNEVPWHAAIYSAIHSPRRQICGGTLVSYTIVISAAHCVWGNADLPISSLYFSVAVGKLYRSWNSDEGGQKSEVSEIKVPRRFMGASANYQDDIALLILASTIKLASNVRPVCIDFNKEFDDRQLRPGNVGKVAGWGLTSADGNPSQVLKVADFPYVDVVKCINDMPSSFRSYLTSDKICAGNKTGAVVCKGDSGGGLVFPETERGVVRWYLRGIASTAPVSPTGHGCNTNTYIAFTHIIKHDSFIKAHLNAPPYSNRIADPHQVWSIENK